MRSLAGFSRDLFDAFRFWFIADPLAELAERLRKLSDEYA